MYKSIQVIDEFYADPLGVRALALKHGKWLPKGDAYSRETENSFFTPGMIGRFEALIGAPIEVDPRRMGVRGLRVLRRGRRGQAHYSLR